MNDQTSFELVASIASQPLVRNTDPATSHEAAARIEKRIPPLEALVIYALREFGPATTNEIARRLGLDLVTVSPRIKPLRDKHLIAEPLPEERRDGRNVWRLVSP